MLTNSFSRLIPTEEQPLLPVNADGTRAVDRNWAQKDTWKQMEELYLSGKVKAIGVSNWSVPYLEDLAKSWDIVPAVNQVRKLSLMVTRANADRLLLGFKVELHPYNPQHKLKEWCQSQGILLEAYCPLGSTGEYT